MFRVDNIYIIDIKSLSHITWKELERWQGLPMARSSDRSVRYKVYGGCPDELPRSAGQKWGNPLVYREKCTKENDEYKQEVTHGQKIVSKF